MGGLVNRFLGQKESVRRRFQGLNLCAKVWLGYTKNPNALTPSQYIVREWKPGCNNSHFIRGGTLLYPHHPRLHRKAIQGLSPVYSAGTHWGRCVNPSEPEDPEAALLSLTPPQAQAHAWLLQHVWQADA